jgi:hypothetical protein
MSYGYSTLNFCQVPLVMVDSVSKGVNVLSDLEMQGTVPL